MLCSDPQPEIFPTQKLLFASICTTKIRRHDIFVPNKLQTTLTQEQFSLDFFPRSTSACTHKTWRRRLRWFIKRRTETFLGKFLCQQFWFTQKTKDSRRRTVQLTLSEEFLALFPFEFMKKFACVVWPKNVECHMSGTAYFVDGSNGSVWWGTIFPLFFFSPVYRKHYEARRLINWQMRYDWWLKRL